MSATASLSLAQGNNPRVPSWPEATLSRCKDPKRKDADLSMPNCSGLSGAPHPPQRYVHFQIPGTYEYGLIWKRVLQMFKLRILV